MSPEPVRDSISPQGMQPGVSQQDFQRTMSSRIAVKDSVDITSKGSEHLYSLIYQISKQRSAQVAFSKGWNDHHDQFAGVFLSPRDLQAGPQGGAGRNAYQQPFLPGSGAGCGEGILTGNADDLIINFGIQNCRDKSSTDTLKWVR